MSKVSSDNDEDNVAATPGGTAGADDNDDDTLPQHITHMPSRSMSSFRARLRAARDPTKDPGGGARGNAAVSLFRWETRGHFWSAVEKAGDPTADPNAAAVGWRGWLNTIYRTVAVGLKVSCGGPRATGSGSTTGAGCYDTLHATGPRPSYKFDYCFVVSFGRLAPGTAWLLHSVPVI